ncbi:MAG: succinate dehydrogenase assembly factor 2 [Gammaproteobacteria bacterium]
MMNSQKARLRWACRRGMLELDLILIPFFDHYFDALSPKLQSMFARLLAEADPDLFQWLMGYGTPQDAELAEMVNYIYVRIFPT